MSELRALTTRLLQTCKDAGAADVEVLVEAVEVRTYRDGIEGRVRSPVRRSNHVAIRARDGRGATGVASATNPRESALDELARAAVARAKAGKPDPHGGPVNRMDLPERGLGILDLRLPTLEEEDRLNVNAINLEGVEGIAEGITAVGFTYQEEQRERLIHTSAGVVASEPSSFFRLEGAVADAQTGITLSDTVESRHFADVASVPLGVNLARRLESYRTTAQRPDGPCSVVVDPLAVAQLLPTLVRAFDARYIAAGKSFLADRLGQAIGSPRLHLIDDPGLAGALRTRAFDGRGVPPMALPLLREGVCGATYMDPSLAHERRQRPTGHSHADGSLWAGNLIVRAGSRSRNMLLPDHGRHVAIAEFLDLSGVNLKKGTLDLPVRLLAMDGPQIIGMAGVARLTCPIETLLGSIMDVCSDQGRIRDVDACTWICTGIELTDA